MIQRIQHLYLLISVLICSFMLAADLSYFRASEGGDYVLVGYANTFIQTDEAMEKLSNLNLWMMISTFAGLSLFSIFLFKKRALQLRLIGLSLVISAALVWAMYVYSVQRNYFENGAQLDFLPAVFLPFCLLVFNVLAYRGVLRDERLIRSMNRLR